MSVCLCCRWRVPSWCSSVYPQRPSSEERSGHRGQRDEDRRLWLGQRRAQYRLLQKDHQCECDDTGSSGRVYSMFIKPFSRAVATCGRAAVGQYSRAHWIGSVVAGSSACEVDGTRGTVRPGLHSPEWRVSSHSNPNIPTFHVCSCWCVCVSGGIRLLKNNDAVR